MEFINNVGHVFSLKSYEDDPIGEKYNEQDYIFWIKEDQISVNNYYILPIKFIVDLEMFKITEKNDFNIQIESDSLFFKLIGPKTIQEKLEETNDLHDCIFFNKNDENFKSILTKDDFYYYFDDPELGTSFEDNIIGVYQNKSYIIFPFYVIGYSTIEGTFLSNIMIKLSIGSESTEYRIIKRELSKEQYFDQIIKKSFSPINIYYYGPNGTDQKQLIYTMEPNYDGSNQYEILYPDVSNLDIEEEKKKYSKTYVGLGAPKGGKIISSLDTQEEKTDQSNRVHNFVTDKALPADVYHYIQKINSTEVHLNNWNESYLPPGYYSFEGEIYDGCEYCGSILSINHEGWYSNRQNNNYNNSNFPNAQDIRTMRLSSIHPWKGNRANQKDENGKIAGYRINSSVKVNITTPIMDLWFDIDNFQVVENPGDVVEEIKQYLPITYYTPITVGGTFIDECEELIINGKNMGVRLPKEIIKAVYQSSIYNNTSDEKLFKDKIKELLLNYMSIKGECGNFRSMLNSLKWFGWNNKIEISKLIKTDNQFQNQYILDYFNVDTDIKSTFRFFRDTNLIDLSINENQETGNIYPQDFSKNPQYDGFIGEGNPELEDLFDKVVEVKQEHLSFYKPYYDFNLRELSLKLDCLAYYYQTYFLPIHIKINRASIERTVYANHIKMNQFAFTKITPQSVFISNNDVLVEFPDTHELLYYKTKHLIDKKYNEFSNYSINFNDEDLYEIDENNIFVPIKIIYIPEPYSKYNKGEYILIDSEEENKESYLIKPDIFLKYDNNQYIKTTPNEATHYQISKYHDIETFENKDRYENISTWYFNCNLILTYTYKVNYKKLIQEYQQKYNNSNILNILHNEGYKAYAEIDGDFVCLEVLNKDTNQSFIQLKDKFNNSNLLGNYFEYNNKLIYLYDKDIYWIKYGILINQKFNYYQNINQYYMNLVLVPRLFKDNIDWLKCTFKISMFVNNKWFEYEFIVKTPNLYIQLGKLNYKYYLKDDFSMFKQIKSINNNKVYFNSFMYQPSLVTIDTLFKDDNNNILDFFEKIYSIGLKSEELYDNKINLDYINEDLNNYIDELNDLKLLYDSKLFRQFYDNYYRGKISIPYNKKFYNRIHLFNLYNNDKLIEYDNNPINIELYQALFDENGNPRIILNELVNYDMYLMHDKYETYSIIEANEYNLKLERSLQYGSIKTPAVEAQEEVYYTEEDEEVINSEKEIGDIKIPAIEAQEAIYYNKQEVDEYNRDLEGALKPGDLKHPAYWYIVFISRYPIYYYSDENLKIHHDEYSIGTYKIKYSRNSLDKFLVNRMDIELSNGMNHFNSDDMIIVSILNNNQYFNIDLHNKWTITHINDYTQDIKLESNTNTMIIHNQNANQKYMPGYYNILLNYTIDGMNNYQYETKVRFRVNKENENNIYPIGDDNDLLEYEIYHIEEENT